MTSIMDEKSFVTLVESTLKDIEAQIEASGADIELDFESDGILTLEFDDGSKIIINRHLPAREIWVAARSGGFHFRPENGLWQNTRENIELYALLTRVILDHSADLIDLSQHNFQAPVPQSSQNKSN